MVVVVVVVVVHREVETRDEFEEPDERTMIDHIIILMARKEVKGKQETTEQKQQQQHQCQKNQKEAPNWSCQCSSIHLSAII